jgi:hypothetical protein
MSELTQAQKTVRVYGCGGCGVNIGVLLEKQRLAPNNLIANIDTAYIDTSRSNIHPEIDPANMYLIDGLDGSGKVRRENHKEIDKRTKDILQKFPPLDLNIVLHSASGGSGSVIGPSIISELLEKKAAVIVMVVGSADTRLDADNTLKTIKSYEAIANLRKAPVVMIYQQNSRENKRETVDLTLRGAVVTLAILWSGSNRELDSKDLFNFLNFHVPTSYRPQLAHLSLVGPNETLGENTGDIISVATLAKKGQDVALDPIPEVQYVGFMADESPTGLLENTPTHFFITDGVVDEVGALLNTTLKKIEAQQQARVQKEGLLTSDDEPTSSGLVL